MRRRFRVGVAAAMAAACGLPGGAGLARPAVAQQVMVSAVRSVDAGGGPGMIGPRSVERYARILGLSEEQAEAARALREGYEAQVKDSAQEMRTAMRSAFAAFQDSQDHQELAQATSDAQRRHAERIESLEKALFADIRQLLTAEQEDRWSRVQRLRRRERGLARGSLSGEAVDVTEVVEELRLDAAVAPALAEALEHYESAIDRAIQARDAVLDSAEQDGPGPGREIDIAAIQQAMTRAREAGAQVRDTNRTHARLIESLLPEDRREEFRAAFKRRCFPGVYRPSAVSRALEAAEGLADLSDDQRGAIAGLRASYEREAAAANEAWAAAIEASEAEGRDGMIAVGGSVMRIQMGEEGGPVGDARKARKGVDARAREKLDSILTSAQRERLPRAEEASEWASPASGDAVFIRSGG